MKTRNFMAIIFSVILTLNITACNGTNSQSESSKEFTSSTGADSSISGVSSIEASIEVSSLVASSLSSISENVNTGSITKITDYTVGGNAFSKWSALPEDEVIKSAAFIAKCHLIKDPEIYKLIFWHKGKEWANYESLYTVKLDKIYSSDADVKEGDIVSYFCSDFIDLSYKNKVRISYYSDAIIPKLNDELIIMPKVIVPPDESYENWSNLLHQVSPYVSDPFRRSILKIGDNKYKMSSNFKTIDEKIDAANKDIHNGIYSISNLDEMIFELINKYK